MELKIIKKRKLWYLLSGTLVVLSIFSLIFFKLNLAIDFTGGSLLEIELSDKVNNSIDLTSGNSFAKYLNENVSDNKTGNIVAQKNSSNGFILRFKEVGQSEKDELVKKLKEKVDQNVKEMGFESIGPTLGSELKRNTFKAILIASIAIVLYVAYAFRKVSYPIKSWKYGVIGIIALLHDILITMGVFAVLGKFLNIEVDMLFITALLTILGYSINDTIVIYDRIRENVLKINGEFNSIVDKSINETMARSINTTVTTLLSLVAVFLFGGDSIKMFALALIIGITLGAYSSIFIASPLLVTLHNFENKKKLSK